MTYEEFVTALDAVYGKDNQERSKIVLSWVMANVDESLLSQLYILIIERERFYPLPSAILPLLGDLNNQSGNHAFRIATNAVKMYGVYGSVVFEDERIAETIRIVWGTWIAFGIDSTDEYTMMKRFCEVYERLPRRKKYNGNLAGRIEMSGAKIVPLNMIEKPKTDKVLKITIGE